METFARGACISAASRRAGPIAPLSLAHSTDLSGRCDGGLKSGRAMRPCEPALVGQRSGQWGLLRRWHSGRRRASTPLGTPPVAMSFFGLNPFWVERSHEAKSTERGQVAKDWQQRHRSCSAAGFSGRSPMRAADRPVRARPSSSLWG